MRQALCVSTGTVSYNIYIYIYIHTINVYIPAHVIHPQTIVLVTNRVPVARSGPKLSQNESYDPQEPFKTPPTPL